MERPTISVDADEESLRVRLRGPVDKQTISGSKIYSDSIVVCGNELLKSSVINLSSGSTAD